MSELGAINCCTCPIMSGLSWILFRLVQPWIRCYSTWLIFETMSEPFQIIFKFEKVGIRYRHSLYVLNNVWILFQSVKSRIGVYSTWLESQTMSKPFQIFFKFSKVRIRCNKLFYMLNNVWITLNIISIG